jgi:hypothetical protein
MPAAALNVGSSVFSGASPAAGVHQDDRPAFSHGVVRDQPTGSGRSTIASVRALEDTWTSHFRSNVWGGDPLDAAQSRASAARVRTTLSSARHVASHDLVGEIPIVWVSAGLGPYACDPPKCKRSREPRSAPLSSCECGRAARSGARCVGAALEPLERAPRIGSTVASSRCQ